MALTTRDTRESLVTVMVTGIVIIIVIARVIVKVGVLVIVNTKESYSSDRGQNIFLENITDSYSRTTYSSSMATDI